MQMSGTTLVLFLLAAFGAEILGTMAGFGAATVLTPIASLFMDVKTAVAVVACFHLFGNASRIVFFRRAIDWSIVGRFGMTGVMASFLGAYASIWLSSDSIRILLGAFLLSYVLLEVREEQAVTVPPTSTTLLAGGMGSGLIAGLIGTGGAVRSICLLAFGLPKDAYIGTSAVIALIVDATRIPVYLAGKRIPLEMVPVLAALTVVAFAGSWAGSRLVRRVSPARFKQLVLVMLLAMGLKLLLDGFRGLG